MIVTMLWKKSIIICFLLFISFLEGWKLPLLPRTGKYYKQSIIKNSLLPIFRPFRLQAQNYGRDVLRYMNETVRPNVISIEPQKLIVHTIDSLFAFSSNSSTLNPISFDTFQNNITAIKHHLKESTDEEGLWNFYSILFEKLMYSDLDALQFTSFRSILRSLFNSLGGFETAQKKTQEFADRFHDLHLGLIDKFKYFIEAKAVNLLAGKPWSYYVNQFLLMLNVAYREFSVLTDIMITSPTLEMDEEAINWISPVLVRFQRKFPNYDVDATRLTRKFEEMFAIYYENLLNRFDFQILPRFYFPENGPKLLEYQNYSPSRKKRLPVWETAEFVNHVLIRSLEISGDSNYFAEKMILAKFRELITRKLQSLIPAFTLMLRMKDVTFVFENSKTNFLFEYIVNFGQEIVSMILIEWHVTNSLVGSYNETSKTYERQILSDLSLEDKFSLYQGMPTNISMVVQGLYDYASMEKEKTIWNVTYDSELYGLLAQAIRAHCRNNYDSVILETPLTVLGSLSVFQAQRDQNTYIPDPEIKKIFEDDSKKNEKLSTTMIDDQNTLVAGSSSTSSSSTSAAASSSSSFLTANALKKRFDFVVTELNHEIPPLPVKPSSSAASKSSQLYNVGKSDQLPDFDGMYRSLLTQLFFYFFHLTPMMNIKYFYELIIGILPFEFMLAVKEPKRMTLAAYELSLFYCFEYFYFHYFNMKTMKQYSFDEYQENEENDPQEFSADCPRQSSTSDNDVDIDENDPSLKSFSSSSVLASLSIDELQRISKLSKEDYLKEMKKYWKRNVIQQNLVSSEKKKQRIQYLHKLETLQKEFHFKIKEIERIFRFYFEAGLLMDFKFQALKFDVFEMIFHALVQRYKKKMKRYENNRSKSSSSSLFSSFSSKDMGDDDDGIIDVDIEDNDNDLHDERADNKRAPISDEPGNAPEQGLFTFLFHQSKIILSILYDDQNTQYKEYKKELEDKHRGYFYVYKYIIDKFYAYLLKLITNFQIYISFPIYSEEWKEIGKIYFQQMISSAKEVFLADPFPFPKDVDKKPIQERNLLNAITMIQSIEHFVLSQFAIFYRVLADSSFNHQEEMIENGFLQVLAILDHPILFYLRKEKYRLLKLQELKQTRQKQQQIQHQLIGSNGQSSQISANRDVDLLLEAELSANTTPSSSQEAEILSESGESTPEQQQQPPQQSELIKEILRFYHKDWKFTSSVIPFLSSPKSSSPFSSSSSSSPSSSQHEDGDEEDFFPLEDILTEEDSLLIRGLSRTISDEEWNKFQELEESTLLEHSINDFITSHSAEFGNELIQICEEMRRKYQSHLRTRTRSSSSSLSSSRKKREERRRQRQLSKKREKNAWGVKRDEAEEVEDDYSEYYAEENEKDQNDYDDDEDDDNDDGENEGDLMNPRSSQGWGSQVRRPFSSSSGRRLSQFQVALSRLATKDLERAVDRLKKIQMLVIKGLSKKT